MAFVNVRGVEVRNEAHGTSYANPAEAKVVANIIAEMMTADATLASGEAIGIITPYAGQVTVHLPTTCDMADHQ